MRLIVFFLTFCSTIISFGSTTKDSLFFQKEVKYLDTSSMSTVKRIQRRQQLILLAKEKNKDEGWVAKYLVHQQANDYSRIGDFDRAIELGTSLKAFYKQDRDIEYYMWTCNDLAIFHSNALRYKESLSLFREALLVAKQSKYTNLYVDFKDGIASNLLNLGRIKEATVVITEIDKLLPSVMGPYADETKMHFYVTKARYFEYKTDTKAAIEYFEKALILSAKINHRKGMYVRTSLSFLYQSIQEYRKAVNVSLGILKQINLSENPDFKDTYLMSGYHELANAYWKLGKSDSALYYMRQSEKQYAFFHNQYVFEESKLFQDNDRRNNSTLGVQVAYELYQKLNNKEHLFQALLFADKAKSNVLNERLQVSTLLKNSVRQEIRELRFQWVYLLNEYESSGNTKMAIQLRNSLDSLDRALGLRKQPVFDAQSIKDIQRKMASGQLILEYFIHDKSVYIFSITKGNIAVTKKEFTTSSTILSFYRSLQNPNSGTSDYFKQGMDIYEQLLPERWSKYRAITIIPDGVLYYLPFDALPTGYDSDKSWSGFNYLGKTHTITYDFSLQTVAQKSKYNYTTSYAGFAPRFDSNAELTYLTNGAAVIQQGKDALGGDVYAGKDASSVLLRKYGLDAEVLQLYTHAVSSDSSYDASYIYMADKRMYVDEIMTLPLHAKLCLLTACEVGLGKIYSGEGVTGVAWAFRAAGAQNVVQSLWRINQESSAYLMHDFFELLADGISSSEALQQAKLKYLTSEDVSERLKHPYYWAGISHYGNASVSNKWSITQILLLSGVFSLGVFGAYSLARRLKGKSSPRRV